jgi:hypothetical protein
MRLTQSIVNRAAQHRLVISTRLGLILKESLLNIPSLDVINLHPETLPTNRHKSLPSQWDLKPLNQARVNAWVVLLLQIHAKQCKRLITKSLICGIYWVCNGEVASLVTAVDQIETHGFTKTKAQQGLGKDSSFPTEQEINIFCQKGKGLFDNAEII